MRIGFNYLQNESKVCVLFLSHQMVKISLPHSVAPSPFVIVPSKMSVNIFIKRLHISWKKNQSSDIGRILLKILKNGMNLN